MPLLCFPLADAGEWAVYRCPQFPSGGARDSPRHARGSGGETSNARPQASGRGTERAPGRAHSAAHGPFHLQPYEAPTMLSTENAREMLAQPDNSHSRTWCDTPYIPFVQPDTADPGMAFPVTGVQICTRRRSPKPCSQGQGLIASLVHGAP